MRLCFVLRMSVIVTLLAALYPPLSVQAQFENPDEALDQELRWLQAEAEATVSIATKTEMGVNDAPSIVSVITEEEIRNSGAKDLEEVLRQVAGFYMYRGTFPSVVSTIRGMGEQANPSVKIMVNGHSMENPVEQNQGWIIAFPVDLIRKIEIIRGPGSALYGNAAMNGVINIITKDSKDPSRVSAAYGSFDTYRGTAELSYSQDDLGLYLFADAYYSDGDPQWVEKDAASKNFSPEFSHAPGHTIEDFECRTFFTKLSYRNFWLAGFLKDDNRQNSIGMLRALTDENDLPDEAAFVEAGYEGGIGEGIGFSARAYYDYMIADIRYEFYGEKTAPLFGDYPEDEGVSVMYLQKLYKVGSEFTADMRPWDSLEIVAGGLLEYVDVYESSQAFNSNLVGKDITLDGVTYGIFEYVGGMREVPDYPPSAKEDRVLYAGYVQGTWDLMKAFPGLEGIGKNLTLTAGLRYDDYDDIGDTLNPRAGLVYSPNERLFFKALYGKAFRAPGFNEMYYRNNPGAVGNPDLEPETVKTAEILAGVRLSDHVTATLDFFNVRKENAIRLYQTRYLNWGEVESRGAEGEIRVSFDKSKYAYLNLTFQKVTDVTDDPGKETITDAGGSEYVQEDFNFGLHPGVMANLGINSDFGRHVNANLSVSYIGSVERVGRKRFTPDTDDPDGTIEKIDNREAMDSCTLVNLSLRFGDFDFAPGLEFQLTGYNIFDADHRDPDMEALVENDFPRWDRHFLGKLTYTF